MDTEKSMLAIMLIASPRYITEAHLRHVVGAWRPKHKVLRRWAAEGHVSAANVFSGDHMPAVVGYTLTDQGVHFAREMLFDEVKLW